MTPLRPLLSSKEMFVILDNAESILDPKGTNAEEIYSVVEELSQFKRVCLCITSRITTVPQRCERPDIPTLSVEAACDIFYGIYRNIGRSNVISDLLGRLDFHALSITLLATTASQNSWNHDRLVKEWDTQRARVLRTLHNKSLAATIELSLASPTFQSLGTDARNLLGVVAFFPQGIDENNLTWLFPTIPDAQNIFDGFCVLSLTYRSNNFVTMLAPIRDYLRPQDPQSSPLLCATRDHYFSRLSVTVNPNWPGFQEARWITSEDVNVEHLLGVFASLDQNVGDAWEACYHFIEHLVWHKPRQTVLRRIIEGLPVNHSHKPKCLYMLSLLFQQIGNHGEQKKILVHTLELQRQRGDDSEVAQTIEVLSGVNRMLGLRKEGIERAREALEIFERIGDTVGQGDCLSQLTWLLLEDKQLDAAENTASRAIDLLSGEGKEYRAAHLHRGLGKIHYLKGRKEKAIHHFNTALEIASPRHWDDHLFWVHYSMADLFLGSHEYDEAHTHIEQAKSYAGGGGYRLGGAMGLQAKVWYFQGRLEDAKTEALKALEIFEKVGAAHNADICSHLLLKIEQAMKNRSADP